MLNNIRINHRKIVIVVLLVLLTILLIVGFILFKNYSFQKMKSNQTEEKKNTPLKENQIVYKDYVYTLPDGWKRNDDYTEALNILSSREVDGVKNQMGSIIDIKEFTSTEYRFDSIFEDISFFENKVKSNNHFTKVEEGKIIHHGDTPVVVFPCYFGDNSQVLLVYTPAYDNHYYSIEFYSNKFADGKEEMDFDYYDIFIVVDFLNTREKK